MKRLLVLGLTLLMASNAMAQVDPDPNGIGLFFDTGYTNRCGTVAGGMAAVYLVASNISMTGLAGWEVQVRAEGAGAMFLNATLAGQGPINLWVAPEFQVGLGVPMVAQPNLLLATLNYFVMAPSPVILKVGPTDHVQSIPGEACYADMVDVGILVKFQPPQGSWTLPAAILNGACDIVDAQEETWGGVKGMFR